MRIQNKTEIAIPLIHLSSQPQLHLQLSAFPLKQCKGTGDGGCGQFTCLCCSFVLTLALCVCGVPPTGHSLP